MRVLAIFGPTASGKSAVAEEVARLIPAELVSADAMQVYRGLPILTNQSEARLVGYLGLDEEGSVAEYQRLAHAAVDEILAAGRTPVVVGGTGLYLRAALADLELPPPPAPGARERLEGLYDELGPRPRTSCSPSAIRPRRPRCTRTTAAGSCARSSWPRPGRACGRARTGSGAERRGTRRWSSASTSLPRSWHGGSRQRTRVDVRARGGGGGATRARRPDLADRPHDPRPRRGRRAPREEAIEALITRTRRYAAYQRKWMRRIPGLVPIDGNRPPAEVAQEIVTQLGSVAG